MTANLRSDGVRGRTGLRHHGHVDYLYQDRLVHLEAGREVDHVIEVTERNPDRCDPAHRAEAMPGHVHGPDCGHERVPHGDHLDYLVMGRLQHPHGDHVDDHGPVTLA
jgi:hypothetical protein